MKMLSPRCGFTPKRANTARCLAARRCFPTTDRARFTDALEEIRSGRFTKEWSSEQENGYPRFEELRKRAGAHALNDAEKLALEAMKRSGVE